MQYPPSSGQSYLLYHPTMDFNMRALYATALALFIFLPCSVMAAISPALFEVSKQGHTSYFFGSVHMGEARYYPLPSAIEQRFKQSQRLVMEIDMADESAIQMEMMQLMMQHGMYLDGSDLKTHIPSSLYRQTMKTAERLGVPANSIQQLRPWAVALLIGQHYYLTMGLDPNWGVDQYFSQQAIKTGKAIYGLETLAEQINAMLAADGEGSSMLQQVLDEADSSSDYTQRMMTAWEKGNSSELSAIFNEELDDTQADKLFVEHLLLKRNQNWLQQLKPMMKKETLFVVVGAAHLVGPENILDSFRQAGYQVKAVSY
ncbi:TraB/GumN family protein [Corallincola luteus]|uniref:TraB/GumN family protein n=2 Tax=Corallincola luteus TaxID=1775177 RepID=A0ABY2AQ73_9GAMM|nr:TraB/GumN family protein [Corallincola luteus]